MSAVPKRDRTSNDTYSDDESYGLRQIVGLFGGAAVFIVFVVLPLPEGMDLAAWRAAAVGLLMAIWWMTEALPIAVTSLLPLVFFPVLGINEIRDAAAPYANPLVFLFMGGFMIALAMQRWGLHRRLALNIIRLIGARPLPIIAGFMLASAFLSMWVSNTATAMMILPIGLSIIELAQRQKTTGHENNFALVLLLAIAYSCSVGGMSTLVGTPPNALFAGYMIETYGVEIAFVDWMMLGLALLAIALPLIFFVLTRLVYPVRLAEIPGGSAYIEKELSQLGPMTRPERMVAVVFVLTALLWITRPLLDDVISGLSDPGIAIGCALLLFVLPVDIKRGAFVLNWDWARRLPWGVLILFGGGLSLAAAINDTGLAAWLGGKVELLAGWPIFGVTAVVVAVIIMLTELTSNLATTAAFLPIVASIAVGIGQDPLLLAVPATLAASCAFMLPVATPPNAIIYGSNRVTIPQMARAGLVLNILFIVVITLVSVALMPLFLDINVVVP